MPARIGPRTRPPVIDTLESRLLMAVQPVISEFLAANKTTNADENGDFSDWLEVHNPDAAPLDLSGYYLTDKSAVPTQWQFPQGVTVPGNGYLLVWASSKNRRVPGSPLHTNFALGASGEYLALVKPDGVTVASAYDPAFPAQSDDVSYGIVGANVTTPNYGFFNTPTPGAANPASGFNVAAAPTFSHERGFYDAPFALTLTTETAGATIRYTTNGSAPTSSSTAYSGPINVTTTTHIRAAAFKSGLLTSDVVTHSFIFLDHVLQQPANIPGFPTGQKVLNGSGDVAPQDPAMDPAVVNNPAYRDMIKGALKSIPTMSLTGRLSDLFGANGIYDSSETSDLEVPVSIELIDPANPNDSTGVTGAAEGQSHDRMKRSLRLSFKPEYGPSRWKTDLLRNGPLGNNGASDELDGLVLRAGNNRSWARGNDPTSYTEDEWYRASQIAIAISGNGSHGTFVHLYINGAYWGLYNVAERPDENWNEAYYGGQEEDYYTVSHDREAGDSTRWDYLMGTLLSRSMSNASNYQELTQYVDLKQFSEYLLLSWYQAQTDWPDNNWWAGGGTPSNPVPFRFYAWDGEKSWDKGDFQTDGALIEPQFMTASPEPIVRIWQAAIQNRDFRAMFSDIAYRLVANDGPLSDARAIARWDALTIFVKDAVVGESARWGDAAESVTGETYTRDEHWVRNVAKIRSMMTGNGQRLIDALRDEGWYPSINPPTFAQRGGQVPMGFQMVLNAPSGSNVKVYYTTDGTDPRLPGDGISAAAKLYQGPVTLSATADVRIRALQGTGTWSAGDGAVFNVSAHSALRVVELMYHPLAPQAPDTTDKNEFEFIELQNTGNAPLNLNGVRFTTGITYTFGDVTLRPGAFIVVAKNRTAFASRYPGVALADGQYTGALDNAGERIVLVDPSGATIQDFTYDDGDPTIPTWHPTTDGPGPSLMIVNPLADPSAWSTAGNWRASWANHGTPGAANEPPQNQAPVVNVSGPASMTLPTNVADINAAVTDDGLPAGGAVTFTWSKLSGPGTVTFGDAGLASTTASFSAAGTYVLRATASDGALSGTAELTIIVHPSAPPPNQAPAVSVDGPSAITLPGTATLNASVTDDGLPSGGGITLTWSKVSGPGSVTFANPSAASTTAAFSEPGTYVLRATADDGHLSGTGELTILVNPPNPNTPVPFAPVGDAYVYAGGASTNFGGAAQLVVKHASSTSDRREALLKFDLSSFGATIGTVKLRLFGRILDNRVSSLATDVYKTSTAWVENAVTWNNRPSSSGSKLGTVTVTGTAGTWLELDVTQFIVAERAAGRNAVAFLLRNPSTSSPYNLFNSREAAQNTPQLVVTPAAPPVNQAPAVDAGPGRTIFLSGSASLDGTVSDDALPANTLSTGWSKVSGPGDVTFGNSAIIDTTAESSEAGTYVLRLTASDGALTSSDEVTVVVNPPPVNQPPVVSAGPDRTITLPGAASLDGTVSDDGLPSGAPVVTWTKVSGPGNVTFANPGAIDTTASFSLAGTYVLRLTADDGTGPVFDELTVTVSPGPAVANAITRFAIIDVNTSAEIMSLNDGDTINLATLPSRFNIRAVEATPTVKSVRFGLDSTSSYRTDSISFFTLFSQDRGGGTLSAGQHTISARPYTGTRAGGTAGATFTARINVINVANPAPPAAPSNLTATATSHTTVALAWADNSNNEGGFQIESSTDGVEFIPLATVGAGVRSYTAANLPAEAQRWFRVRATNGFGNSDYTNVADAVTPAAPAGPAVTSLVLINAGTDADVLTLSDGMTLSASQVGISSFTVRAETNSAARSVIFGYGGTARFRLEKTAPFALFGDSNGDYTGQSFTAGTYTITVTPFASSDGTGAAGAAYKVTFTVA